MSESRTLLERIEWHDLPVRELRIAERTVDLFISPFDEETDQYSEAQLQLAEPSELFLDIRGDLSISDLLDLEVFSFEYEIHEDGTLSGKIKVIAGKAGVWSIQFSRAYWDLSLVESDVIEFDDDSMYEP